MSFIKLYGSSNTNICILCAFLVALFFFDVKCESETSAVTEAVWQMQFHICLQ